MSQLLTPFAITALLLLLAAIPSRAQGLGYCRDFVITGYVRTEFSAHTFDGTSIYSDERIVAASWDIPLGHYVVIEDLGMFRVADRGLLGSDGWLDVAVWSRPEAYALTGSRRGCVFSPEELF